MLADLDVLLAERGLAAAVVPNHELPHPGFRWLSRGARVTRGTAVHVAGGDTILVHDPMEREEAAAAGLRTMSTAEVGQAEIFRDEADPAAAWAAFYGRLLDRAGARGPIALLGPLPMPLYLGIVEALEAAGRKVWRGSEDLIQRARKRKEPWELEAVASVGRRTEEVVDTVREMLRQASLSAGEAWLGGERLTLGRLKDHITAEILRRGMIEDHDTIVSQGRDAGIPHARGDRAATLRASLPLVIDIFPADRVTGYFFDLTRTFCIGPIPARLLQLHGEVLEAFELARDAMRAGEEASSSQARVCDFFEARGHRTGRSHPGTTEGYVHGLGHGVGLEVHERPSFALAASNHDLVEAGDVLTIEPGLYYPGEGIGVRIEDTFFIDASGRPVTFCSSRRELAP